MCFSLKFKTITTHLHWGVGPVGQQLVEKCSRFMTVGSQQNLQAGKQHLYSINTYFTIQCLGQLDRPGITTDPYSRTSAPNPSTAST